MKSFKLNQNLFTFRCWYCQKSTAFVDINKMITKNINNCSYYFRQCQSCQQQIYVWKDHNQVYYGPKIHVVLYEPEIVGNVGTIIRLTVNFGFALHLIQPFGFIYSNVWLKRSSANHFQKTTPLLYEDWNAFLNTQKPQILFFTSDHAQQTLQDVNFSSFVQPIYLVFGRESVGLPKYLLKNPVNCFRIETGAVSSINLANSVGLIVYQIFAQFKMLNLR